jgi:hypothetical protein
VEGVFAKKFSGAGEDFDRIDGPMPACGTNAKSRDVCFVAALGADKRT